MYCQNDSVSTGIFLVSLVKIIMCTFWRLGVDGENINNSFEGYPHRAPGRHPPRPRGRAPASTWTRTASPSSWATSASAAKYVELSMEGLCKGLLFIMWNFVDSSKSKASLGRGELHKNVSNLNLKTELLRYGLSTHNPQMPYFVRHLKYLFMCPKLSCSFQTTNISLLRSSGWPNSSNLSRCVDSGHVSTFRPNGPTSRSRPDNIWNNTNV